MLLIPNKIQFATKLPAKYFKRFPEAQLEKLSYDNNNKYQKSLVNNIWIFVMSLEF